MLLVRFGDVYLVFDRFVGLWLPITKYGPWNARELLVLDSCVFRLLTHTDNFCQSNPGATLADAHRLHQLNLDPKPAFQQWVSQLELSAAGVDSFLIGCEGRQKGLFFCSNLTLVFSLTSIHLWRDVIPLFRSFGLCHFRFSPYIGSCATRPALRNAILHCLLPNKRQSRKLFVYSHHKCRLPALCLPRWSILLQLQLSKPLHQYGVPTIFVLTTCLQTTGQFAGGNDPQCPAAIVSCPTRRQYRSRDNLTAMNERIAKRKEREQDRGEGTEFAFSRLTAAKAKKRATAGV